MRLAPGYAGNEKMIEKSLLRNTSMHKSLLKK